MEMILQVLETRFLGVQQGLVLELIRPLMGVFRAGVFGLRPQFGLPASLRGSWCCGAGGVFGLRPQTPIKLGVEQLWGIWFFGICSAYFVNDAPVTDCGHFSTGMCLLGCRES